MNALERPIVCIVGPTASGKTAAAIELAIALEGEIVSADSVQLYRRLDVGTAKPTAEQRAAVRHHMIDVADPVEIYSAVRYAQEAIRAIEEAEGRGALPFLVGGTGQYVAAITQGLSPAPAPPNPELRGRLEDDLRSRGLAALAARLADIDPRAAETVDLHNPRRVLRALEVRLATGRSIRELERPGRPARRALVLGLTVERGELSRRIAARTAAMFEAGLVDEVRGLAAMGYSWGSAVGVALGYKQVLGYLLGRAGLTEAREETVAATRRYARRQMTWFRNRERVEWFDARADTVKRMRRRIDVFLEA